MIDNAVRGAGRRRLLFSIALLALAVAGAALFISRCESAKSTPGRIALKHRGAASIVAKGSAGPSQPRPIDEADGLRLEGQVIDEAQQPVAGALVVLLRMDATTTSAEDGSFAFEKLDPRQYRVAAYKDELYAPIVSVRLNQTSEPV